MHIQKMFVIITFNEHLVETAVDLLGRLPLGQKVQGPFKDLLDKQKEKLHRKPGQGVAQVGDSAPGSVGVVAWSGGERHVSRSEITEGRFLGF